MTKVKMAGTLSLSVADVLMELSPEPKDGMVELTEDEPDNKWHNRRLRRILRDCGGKVFYRLHPETIDFFKCFCFTRTYSSNEKYLNLCAMLPDEGSRPGNIVLEQVWKRTAGTGYLTLSNYFSSADGWAMLGAIAPTSDLMTTVLSNCFSKFETNVMGLPSRRIREITKAVLADHYIQFSMRDRKGGFNSLLALVPKIVEAIKKPRFPTLEIQELLAERD